MADPTLKPSVVYNEEVFRVRDTLSETERVEFDNLMPTRSVMNASIFKWKRLVIPSSPDSIGDIDVSGPFFSLESGENMVKFDTLVDGNRDRRLIVLSSDKVMKASIEMASKGVMDATFKVCFSLFFFPLVLF